MRRLPWLAFAAGAALLAIALASGGPARWILGALAVLPLGAFGAAALGTARRPGPDLAGRRSEERYRAIVGAILENAVDGILTIDERGTIDMVNAAALRMFGYDAADLVGRNVSILMPSPHREAHDGYIRRYIETGERRIIGIGREVEGRRKDGTFFPLDLAVNEVVIEGRHVFAGFVRDITARKQAAEELRQQRDFAESLIETAQTIVLVLDREARIVRFNPYMERLSGYRLDDVRGKDWFSTFLPERDVARIRKVFLGALDNLEVRGNVNSIVTKDGREREIAWWARTLRDGEGRVTGVLSMGQDVTDLKHAQESLLQSERLAGIGQMITGLAHESRNALQRMQACLEMLALEIEDRPAAVDYVHRIQAAQDYLGQLYEEVRNYARPIQLELQACDLRRLWGAAWADLALRRGGKAIELLDRTDGLDLHCDVDPFAFGQVFRNIFENAIGACPSPGRIAVLAADAEIEGVAAIRLVINDDGPGFTDPERAFQPFYTTKTEGTGLGLAIVRRILVAHGGRIELSKGPLPGAALALTVPRRRA
jgi:PAS domain S-box-containing protein